MAGQVPSQPQKRLDALCVECGRTENEDYLKIGQLKYRKAICRGCQRQMKQMRERPRYVQPLTEGEMDAMKLAVASQPEIDEPDALQTVVSLVKSLAPDWTDDELEGMGWAILAAAKKREPRAPTDERHSAEVGKIGRALIGAGLWDSVLFPANPDEWKLSDTIIVKNYDFMLDREVEFEVRVRRTK